MDKMIKISNITKMAMSEQDGKNLRTEMQQYLDNGDDVILDFSNISLFATPFFNASIGFFVLRLSPDTLQSKVKLINLSELGEETYKHSLDNATEYFINHVDTEQIGIITKNTIENN